jgi:hypothetical protein
MQSRFFLLGLAPDVAPIAHAFAVRFLEALVLFICIVSHEKLRNTGVALFFRL